MATTVKFRKLYDRNPYKRIRYAMARDAKNLPKAEAAFTRRRARSIMRKAPKKPRSRFGERRFYGPKAKKAGQAYWRKGLYSRPGHPPFHHGQKFNLRTIIFKPISIGAANVPHASTRGGRAIAWRVGPKFRPSRRSIPVPQLHEYGGTVKVTRRGRRFTDRGISLTRRVTTGRLRYPPRPYMKPASQEAKVSVRAKHGGSLPWLVNLGGLHGRRMY